MSQAYMSQDQILDLGHEWAQAELHADTKALSQLLDADFVCVGPLGFMLNKEQYIGARASGQLQQESFEWQDVQVRVYGDAAIAIGSQIQKTKFQGNDVSGQFRVTQVYVRRGSTWTIVSLHLSPIGQPPAFAGGPR
jgi:ketosteroid isomerase-like protein